MSEDIQQVELCGFKNFQYKVDVNVMLQILDFSYRNNNQIVIVTLMGTVYPNKIEVVSCFRAVNQLQAQIDNIQKVFPKQYVLGFAATVSLGNQNQKLQSHIQQLHRQYHEIMQKQQATQGLSPFLLTLDASNPVNFNVQGYVDEQHHFQDQTLIFYQPVQVTLELFSQDKSQMLNYQRQRNQQEEGDEVEKAEFISLEGFSSLVQQLKNNLKVIQKYVCGVVDGDIKGDPKIGLALKKLVRDIPLFSHSHFGSQVTTYLEDVALIMYLKNLLNLQALISDKINKIQL